MFALLIAGPVAALAVILLGRWLLPRRALIAAGIAIVVIGAAAVATIEWRYAPAHTLLVQMSAPLDRAGAVRTAVFRPMLSGPYDIWLEFDRKQDGEDFACLVGTPEAEAVCPRKDPDLALAWSVARDGAPVAGGATDWREWHSRQAALDPAYAAQRRAAYLAYRAKSLNPSDNWPRYHMLGTFGAETGRAYQVTLDVRQSAGALAALHPRLAIGLSGSVTKGLGSLALVFCLLCIVTGAMLLLFAIPRAPKVAQP
jgi:hypothetical protein